MELIAKRRPPNLRPHDEKNEMCGNCDHYDGVCMLYDEYPVSTLQVCDHWFEEYGAA